MKAFIFALIFGMVVFIQNSGYCQSINKTYKFSIGAYYYPAQNTYKIFGETNYGNQVVVKTHNGQNFGILAGYKVNDRINVQTGLGLCDYGYDMEYSGKGYTNGLYNLKVNYLELPIEIQFSGKPKSIQLVGTFGIPFAFLLNKSYPQYISGATQINLNYFDNFDHYNKTLIGINIGAGFKYNYSTRTSLTLQPFAKYFLNQNTQGYFGDDEATHVSSFGLMINITYEL